jgi:glycosyltransferase involved in cell wall biosynthesis
MIPNRPFFSVVIATYDRPQQLANCLQALSQLHYPRDRFEVIVVNDGSPTPLEKVIAIYCDQ